MSNRRAFTLVELLITITIICVLVALLLPILNKVKQSTAQVTCLANMREITSGCLAYAADNDSILPWCDWGAPDGNEPAGWAYAYAPSRTAAAYPANSDFLGSWGSLPHYPLDGVKTGTIWPYIHSLSAYHCPIDNPEFYTGTEWLTSYLCNGAECGYGAMSTAIQLRRIKAPTQSVMLWEAMEQYYQGQVNTGAVWNDCASYPWEEVLAARHYKGANVSCFDGHVEWWDQSTWTYWVNQTTFSRLWCYPLTATGR